MAQTVWELLDKLERYYNFECESGSLCNCQEWRELCQVLEGAAISAKAGSTQIPTTLHGYQQKMARTYKSDRKPNHATGVAGEAAEIVDIFLTHIDALRAAGTLCELVKKDHYHARPADRERVKSELGDLLWYVTALALDYALTLEEVAAFNIEKLQKRYPEGFVKGGGIRHADSLNGG